MVIVRRFTACVRVVRRCPSLCACWGWLFATGWGHVYYGRTLASSMSIAFTWVTRILFQGVGLRWLLTVLL
jgi:hypothetical protein